MMKIETINNCLNIRFKNSRKNRFNNCLDKKGFIILETTIILPFLLIGILTLVYLLKILWIEERTFFTFENEARALSRGAYLQEVNSGADQVNATSFPLVLKSKLYKDHQGDLKDVILKEYKYLYTDQGLTGLIYANLSYDVNIRLPIPFQSEAPIENALLLRGFIGADKKYSFMRFEKMEEEQEVQPVWVFPRAGERYHGEFCTYIKNQPRQMILTASLKQRYDPCSLCKPKEVTLGNVVYCFTRAGSVYHRGSCYSVDRYVIEMDKEEAVTKGYTPCMKCGGN